MLAALVFTAALNDSLTVSTAFTGSYQGRTLSWHDTQMMVRRSCATCTPGSIWGPEEQSDRWVAKEAKDASYYPLKRFTFIGFKLKGKGQWRLSPHDVVTIYIKKKVVVSLPPMEVETPCKQVRKWLGSQAISDSAFFVLPFPHVFRPADIDSMHVGFQGRSITLHPSKEVEL